MSHDPHADKINKYIGEKKIKRVTETDEQTSGGFKLVEVEFQHGMIERFSSLLLDKIITDQVCDASKLRDLRIHPVVAIVLQVLRDWGLKMSELPYFSTVLNQSLDYNHKQALNTLWSQWMLKPKDPEEVDLIAIDRVLKTNNKIQDN